MNCSIGINVIAQNCVKELDQLRKIAAPNSQDVSWDFWKSQMSSGVKIVACFDDAKSIVIGIAMITPNFTGTTSNKEATVENVAVFPNYPALVQRSLFYATIAEAKKCNWTLTNIDDAFPTLEKDLHKQCKSSMRKCLKMLEKEKLQNPKASTARTRLSLYAENLLVGIGMDSRKLNQLIQEIELILPYDPDFKYHLRQDLIGLNDHIKNKQSYSKS